MTHCGVHSLVDDPYAGVLCMLERLIIEIWWKLFLCIGTVRLRIHLIQKICLMRCFKHNMKIVDNFINTFMWLRTHSVK